jgi:hypothetical protein
MTHRIAPAADCAIARPACCLDFVKYAEKLFTQRTNDAVDFIELSFVRQRLRRRVAANPPTFGVGKAGPTRYGEAVNAARTDENRRRRGHNGSTRIIMENSVQKSCWGVTAKAIIGFAGIIFLAWLVGGGAETAAVLASG